MIGFTPYLALFLACLAGAAMTFPRHDPAMRRRLVWALLLLAPFVAAVALGPLVLDPHAMNEARRAWMERAQYAALAACVAIALALLAFMRGARLFVLSLGGAAVLADIALTGANLMAINPGS